MKKVKKTGRVEMSSIPSAVEEDDGGMASECGRISECVSDRHSGRVAISGVNNNYERFLLNRVPTIKSNTSPPRKNDSTAKSIECPSR